MGVLAVAAEDLVIRGEAVILLKAAIMRSVADIKQGESVFASRHNGGN